MKPKLAAVVASGAAPVGSITVILAGVVALWLMVFFTGNSYDASARVSMYRWTYLVFDVIFRLLRIRDLLSAGVPSFGLGAFDIMSKQILETPPSWYNDMHNFNRAVADTLTEQREMFYWMAM